MRYWFFIFCFFNICGLSAQGTTPPLQAPLSYDELEKMLNSEETPVNNSQSEGPSDNSSSQEPLDYDELQKILNPEEIPVTTTPSERPVEHSAVDRSQEKLELELKASQQLMEAMERAATYFEQAELIPVEHLTKVLEREKEKLLDQLHEAGVDQLVKDMDRLEVILRHERQVLQTQSGAQMKVAILGDSSLDTQQGFNQDVLAKLLQLIKQQNPRAVFFTGNLIYALQEEASGNDEEVQLPQEKNIFGKLVSNERGRLDEKTFEQRLEGVAKVMKENLQEIPFYPLIGEQESYGTAALETFKKIFHLDGEILEGKQLVYTVPLGNSLFIAISTEYFEREKKQVVDKQITPEVYKWLETTLKTENSHYRFKFVLGNDPAFSTTASFGIYSGLDQNSQERNRFWNLLKENHVLAYFSGNEILYDRTYRQGVWQFISGGAGALHEFKLRDDTFYHFMLLSIPQSPKGDPRLQVFDLTNKKRDDVTLSGTPSVIFQYRISTSSEG